MFESALASVAERVNIFQAGEKHYLSPGYQEQEARRDFIDRFFVALGWDVRTGERDYREEISGQEGYRMTLLKLSTMWMATAGVAGLPDCFALNAGPIEEVDEVHPVRHHRKGANHA